MSKRTVPDLKELFKQASEIAQQVPESMREAAFNRAIDLLTSETQQKPGSDPTTPSNKKMKSKAKKADPEIETSSSDGLLSAIDSTQHPGVKSASNVLDRSLMVLQIALTEHNIDGLTPSVIASILTEKFRINTYKPAVSMALGKATDLVNRIPEGSGFLYKIMAPGEEYLTHLGESEDSSSVASKPKKVKKKHATNKRKASTPKKKATTEKKDGTDKPTKTKGSVGPKATIINLIDSGYFDTGKTGPEVQTHLKNKRGLNFSIAQLRMAMLRLVRDEVLDRDENAEGQYEYTKSKS